MHSEQSCCSSTVAINTPSLENRGSVQETRRPGQQAHFIETGPVYPMRANSEMPREPNEEDLRSVNDNSLHANGAFQEHWRNSHLRALDGIVNEDVISVLHPVGRNHYVAARGYGPINLVVNHNVAAGGYGPINVVANHNVAAGKYGPINVVVNHNVAAGGYGPINVVPRGPNQRDLQLDALQDEVTSALKALNIGAEDAVRMEIN